MCQKCVSGLSSAPGPSGGDYGAPPDPRASCGGGEWKRLEMEMEWKEGKERNGEGGWNLGGGNLHHLLLGGYTPLA